MKIIRGYQPMYDSFEPYEHFLMPSEKIYTNKEEAIQEIQKMGYSVERKIENYVDKKFQDVTIYEQPPSGDITRKDYAYIQSVNIVTEEINVSKNLNNLDKDKLREIAMKHNVELLFDDKTNEGYVFNTNTNTFYTIPDLFGDLIK